MENITSDPMPSPQVQKALPNATVSLVLGIISIVGCCGWGIIGLVLGIIAIVLANKDEKLYRTNITAYTVASYKNSKAGKVCGIIGVVIGSIYFLLVLVIIAMFGIAALSDPNALRDALQNMQH